MPLKVTVGLSQKIGQPDYGSLGATCHVEFEADSHLLQHDLDGFHRHVATAFVACKQAVQDQLQRHQPRAVSVNVNSNGQHREQQRPSGETNGNGHASPRKATASQVRAIHTIANRIQVDLANWLHEKFGLHTPTQLNIRQASSAIDELKSLPSGSGGAC